MAIPKTPKLTKEDTETIVIKAPAALTKGDVTNQPLQIREVQCLNDFVAIMRTATESNIAIPDASKYKNEGIVVGVGPGVADGAGGRLAPTVKIGDMVLFGEKNIIAHISSDKPPYAGHSIVVVSERNIICKLPHKIDWQPYAEI